MSLAAKFVCPPFGAGQVASSGIILLRQAAMAWNGVDQNNKLKDAETLYRVGWYWSLHLAPFILYIWAIVYRIEK